MDVLGIDLGNYATKTSERVMFPSRVAIGHKGVNASDIKVEYDGKKYTVGSKAGVLNLGPQKINNINYDICLLTAIAQSYYDNNIDIAICVGLPPEQFESPMRDALKKRLNNIGVKEIKIYKGNSIVTKKINIVKAEVFQESAVVFRSPKEYKNRNTLWIDIGGGSTDITEFDGLESVKHTTTKHGMLELYENMKTDINSKGYNMSPEDMEDMLGKDSYIIAGIRRDITFLKDDITTHVANLNNSLQHFRTSNREINVIGGGAAALVDYIKNFYPNATVPDDAQYLNALTYKSVGEMLFNGR